MNGPLAPYLPQTSLVGRQRDLIALARLATSADVRLITVTGAGGIGKTRLALTVMQQVAADFVDGAVFIDFAPLTDPALVVPRIAAALQVPTPETGSLEAALLDLLAERNSLLVLDNLEQLLPATGFLQEMLTHCPDLVLLATSRQRLDLSAEQVFELAPLAVPDQYALSTAESVIESEAVQLFLQRAQAADRHFALTPQNASEIAVLCRRLDGLPLAIELAASRIADIPLHTMLYSFARVLPFLEGAAYDRTGRHQTMRNAIDWSYRSLSSVEQAVFGRLSVFAGNATFEQLRDLCLATEAIAEVPADETALLKVLGSLIDKHLLLRNSWVDATPRYGLLQMVREYGREMLIERTIEPAMLAAHARLMIALADSLRPGLQGADPNQALARFDAELDDFRAALQWLLQHDPAEALRLCNRLAHYWLLRGVTREAERWYRAALDATGALDSEEHAIAFLQLGHLSHSDLAASYRFYEQSLERFQHLGNEAGAAGLLSCLGMAAEQMGRFAEAREHLTGSLEIFTRLDHQRGIAQSSFHLGTLAATRGHYTEARQRLEAARIIWDRLEDTTNAVFTTLELGRLFRLERRYAEAIQLLQWSLDRLHDAGIDHGLGLIHCELGSVRLASGNAEGALIEYRQALDHLHRTASVDRSFAAAVEGMAELFRRGGQDARALELLAAVDRWRGIATATLPRDSGQQAAETAKLARRTLGESAAGLAWTQGTLLTLEAAGKIAREQALTLPSAVPPPKPAPAANPYGLTRQERTVLCLVAEGQTNKQIAVTLSISDRTATTHLVNIFRKLDVENRTQAAAIAHASGLCS